MANWQRKLELQPEWEKVKNDEISIQEMSSVIAKRLKALKPLPWDFAEDKRLELVEEFEWLAESSDVDRDDFDNWLNDLYDWGDIHIDGGVFNGRKVCWINTFLTQRQIEEHRRCDDEGPHGNAVA